MARFQCSCLKMVRTIVVRFNQRLKGKTIMNYSKGAFNLVFSDQPFPENVTRTLFLAGPSPRNYTAEDTYQHWRHEAIRILDEEVGFSGHVFIPIPQAVFYGEEPLNNQVGYVGQVEWEERAMKAADAIVFWIDRDSANPALTTNFELGEYWKSGKVFLGAPAGADKIRYAVSRAKRDGLKFHYSLFDVLDEAVGFVGEGVARTGGECRVPSFIFKSEQFQTWYSNVKLAGNRLDNFDCKLALVFGPKRFLFGFVGWADIWITKEERHKSNECIFSRTATSYILAYHPNPETQSTDIVLVREFRTPAVNEQGYVYELPGGSSFGNETPLETASKELHEEIGIKVTDLSRFVPIACLQPFATMTTNTIQLYAIELNDSEWGSVVESASSGKILGENEGERITLHLTTAETLDEYPLDWTTRGMIYTALQTKNKA